MKIFFRYIGILLLTVIMASCGSSGGGGGSGGGDSSTNSINSGTSTLTVAIGNVSANSGAVTYTDEIPSSVKSVMITVMIQGSIQKRIVNVNGRKGITETFTGPNGTWDVRVIAYAQENAQGPPTHLGMTIQGVRGDTTIYVQMNPVASKFRVFVSNIETSNVSAIDPVTFEIKTLNCTGAYCYSPRNLAANHVDLSVYVPFSNSDNAFIIDADDPALDNEINDEDFYNPYAVAFTCTGAEAWIVNMEGEGDGSISIVDTATGTVTANIRNSDLDSSGESNCLQYPVGIAIANGKAYIANSDSDTVCVVNTDTRTEVTTIPTAGTPRFTAATPNGSFVYVSTSFGIQKIFTGDNTVKHSIPLGQNGGWNLGVAPDGSRIYVPNRTDQIMVIDVNPAPAPDTSFGSVTVSGASDIFGVTVTSDGSLIFATDEEMNDIYAFGPGMVVGGSVDPMVIPNSLGAYVPQAITSSPGVKTEECQTQELCVPVDLSPANGALLDNSGPSCEDPLEWNFSWSSCESEGATGYEIEVYEPNASGPLIKEIVSVPSFAYHSTSTPVTAGPGWMWRVRAVFESLFGDWTTPENFDVESANSDCNGDPCADVVCDTGFTCIDGVCIEGAARNLVGPDTGSCDGDGVGYTTVVDLGADGIRVDVEFINGPPNTSSTIYWVCTNVPGGCHGDACGYITLGTITRDNNGRGFFSSVLPNGNPYPGKYVHFDLIGGGGTFTSITHDEIFPVTAGSAALSTAGMSMDEGIGDPTD